MHCVKKQSPEQDLSNVVANNDGNNSNMDPNELVDEGDQDVSLDAAINEQLKQIEAELGPVIETVDQMKYTFEKMEGKFGVLICLWPPLLLLCMQFFWHGECVFVACFSAKNWHRQKFAAAVLGIRSTVARDQPRMSHWTTHTKNEAFYANHANYGQIKFKSQITFYKSKTKAKTKIL